MSVASKSISAIKSNYVGTVVQVGAQFSAQVLIMRELGPELVGTFGYALLLYGVLALVIDQGFGWSLIKADFNDETEIAIVFSRIMLASLAAMLSVYALSQYIGTQLNNDLVARVIEYSAPSYLLIGLFIVPQAKLRAELRFREIQIATTGSYLIAYPLVGVGMALSGFGVWALLAAWYVQAVLQVVVAYCYSPHSFKLTNPFRGAGSASLGWQIAGINVLNWVVDNVSGVFAGRSGAAALGSYNAASMLARTPAMQLVQTLQTILFSTASLISTDRQLIKRLYLSALASVAFLIIPAYGYAITHADLIIDLVFGGKWKNSHGIFAALLIGMIALPMSILSGSILSATGSQKTVLYSQILCLITMVCGLYAMADISIIYVGIIVSLAYWIRFWMQLKAIMTSNRIAPKELLLVLKGPVSIGLILAFPVSLLGFFDPGSMQGEGLALFLKCFGILLLIKKYPNYFLCPALIDVVARFNLGRQLLARLRAELKV